MAKITLAYDNTWTEEDERRITDALGLSLDLATSLFEKHKAINITQKQLEALNKLQEEMNEEAEDETGDGEQETETETPDTEHPDADVIDVSTASQRDRDAVDMAVTLSGGVSKLIVENYETRERLNILPLLARDEMVAAAKKANKDLASLPVPNSYRKGGKTMVGVGDKAIVLGDNIPWDKFTYTTQNDDNKTVTKTGSYYKSEFAASDAGKRIAKQKQLIANGIAHLKDPATGPAMPKEYDGKNRVQLGRLKKLWDRRESDSLTFLRSVVTLHQQCVAFDGLPNISYSFDTEEENGKQVYVNRNEPITLADLFDNPNKPGVKSEKNHNTIGIAAFNRFDVNKAIEIAGGAEKVTLAHLALTVKRETAEETETAAKDDWSKHEIENISQFENILSSITSFLAVEPGGDNNAKREAALTKRFAENDGMEALLVFGDACIALDNLWSKFSDQYNKANAARAEAALKEKKAREKAAA